MARRASSLNNREQLLADAWANSATGKRDGRLWSDLFDDESATTVTGFKHFNRSNQSTRFPLNLLLRFYHRRGILRKPGTIIRQAG